MKSKIKAVNKAHTKINKNLDKIVQKACGNKDLLKVYLAGELIKFYLPAFKVTKVVEKKSRFSNFNMHLIASGNKYVLNEIVIDAFSTAVRISVESDYDIASFAEDTLKLFIPLCEYGVLTGSSKNGVEKLLVMGLYTYMQAVIEHHEQIKS